MVFQPGFEEAGQHDDRDERTSRQREQQVPLDRPEAVDAATYVTAGEPCQRPGAIADCTDETLVDPEHEGDGSARDPRHDVGRPHEGTLGNARGCRHQPASDSSTA